MSKTSELAGRIEHTVLASDATSEQVVGAAREAARLGLYGLCVSPTRVRLAREALAGTSVALVTVVGFPSGAHRSTVEAFEAATAVSDGADEIDMVADLAAIRERDWRRLRTGVREVVRAVRPHPVKVILETPIWDPGRIVSAARAAQDGGASFVKTGTGVEGSATVEHVALLRRVVGPEVGIKASGGIRTRRMAEALVLAGADRIGTSRGPLLLG